MVGAERVFHRPVMGIGSDIKCFLPDLTIFADRSRDSGNRSMNKRILLHIAFWLTYLGFKTYLNYSPPVEGTAFEEFWKALVAQLALLLVKVPLVYSLFYVAQRYLAKTWSLTRTVLVTSALFLVSVALYLVVNHYIILKQLYDYKAPFTAHISLTSIGYGIFLLFFAAGVALVIKLTRLNLKQKETEQQILQKKLETELQFLKAQTNPHFLFNTLNNIYGMARKNNTQTAEAVMQLSNILRYMLYESSKPETSLEQEIRTIEDYIDLEQMRYKDMLSTRFVKNTDNPAQTIAPLILLPFVENAFKHGSGESRFKSYIHIDLKLVNGLLQFEVENSRENRTDEGIKENIGLKNIRRQLELIYPDHQLDLQSNEHTFRIHLKINLHNGKV